MTAVTAGPLPGQGERPKLAPEFGGGNLMRLLLLATGFLALGIGSAAAGSSSFQRSCTDIRLEVDRRSVYLSATCDNGRGRQRGTDIELTGIHNDDGRLVRGTPGAASSFQRSCRDIRIDASRKRVVLEATCQSRSGRWRDTRIEIEDIHNINGRLQR